MAFFKLNRISSMALHALLNMMAHDLVSISPVSRAWNMDSVSWLILAREFKIWDSLIFCCSCSHHVLWWAPFIFLRLTFDWRFLLRDFILWLSSLMITWESIVFLNNHPGFAPPINLFNLFLRKFLNFFWRILISWWYSLLVFHCPKISQVVICNAVFSIYLYVERLSLVLRNLILFFLLAKVC